MKQPFVRGTLQSLLDNPVVWMSLLHREPESYWIARGKKMAVRLCHAMMTDVSAYRHFLKTQGLAMKRLVSYRDFNEMPLTSKKTYLKKYPLPDLFWGGKLKDAQVTISATSGSTGEPFYFPRTVEQDLQYAAVAEMYLRANYSIHNKSTLYIIGWGMGIWIGGVFSYSALRVLSERGKYAMGIITPGTNQEEILKALERLGPLYDQVIIGGYPPVIKDLVDEGNRRHIRWSAYHTKFIFSAEGFSEKFRDYIIHQAGLTNSLTDTLNHYGTVDLGTMAHETPVSILIRRIAGTLPQLNMALFGEERRQPTFAQYIPELFYFEEHEGRLICTARSGLPLVRYELMDIGGVKTFAEVRRVCALHGVDLSWEIDQAHIGDTVWNVPFVYVFERSDFTVKLSGANIFLGEIRRALEHANISPFVTGKCTLSVDLDKKLNQFLMIHVELQKNVRASQKLEERIRERVIAELLANNSEYAYLSKNLPPKRVVPQLALWPFGDETYFAAKGKHRWVRK